ncbi:MULTISPECIES: glycine cleavage system protein GcvH [Candidatus Ichthyocystis]|uniref:Glycine cleavage system H protein n=1 Tax=Candidatus Ichthyocystis hellenicum TaxID=1561003 RepID=A0A0S4M1L0_9BURK|nr:MULTISPECIES: glycine cleavage system protein GcvH [Ichthyocystis]CUT16876.1 Glycine cleavage system H protein [Candidatus Ichthyocystis hellenicum]
MTYDEIKKLRFTKTHEWVRLGEENRAFVGISEHAQSVLGDIVFLSLPEMGSSVSKGEDCAVIESVKSASDVYTPISGKITAINSQLLSDPQSVNRNAYDSWIFEIELSDKSEMDELLSIDEYEKFIESTEH